MKKIYLILIVVILLIVGYWWFFLGGEVSRMDVEEAEKVMQATECAFHLYQEKKQEGIIFESQCLGTCGDYAVDVVHVPRDEEDNLAENQCSDYREGKVSKFIELDKEGEIVRIV